MSANPTPAKPNIHLYIGNQNIFKPNNWSSKYQNTSRKKDLKQNENETKLQMCLKVKTEYFYNF